MSSHDSHIQPAHSLTSRHYETERDLQQMQELLMEARSRTNDWRYWHVGDLMFEFFMVTCHLNPHKHIRLWHNPADKLVAYSILGMGPTVDWQVLPEYEWSGIEAEAMSWAEGCLAELRKNDPQGWNGHLVSVGRQDNVKRIAFLEENGFQRGDQIEVNMLRSLHESIPDAILPDDCQLRDMVGTDDITNRAGAQREVWHPWPVGDISDDDYERFMQLPGYHHDLDLVAIAPDKVMAAYVNGWIDPVNKIGDFGPVGARPAYRRQGLTRAVLLEGLRRMQAYGMDRVCLSTGESNTPAIRLYESIGFKIVNQYLEFVKKE